MRWWYKLKEFFNKIGFGIDPAVFDFDGDDYKNIF